MDEKRQKHFPESNREGRQVSVGARSNMGHLKPVRGANCTTAPTIYIPIKVPKAAALVLELAWGA